MSQEKSMGAHRLGLEVGHVAGDIQKHGFYGINGRNKDHEKGVKAHNWE
jgi:hypothetical protein